MKPLPLSGRKVLVTRGARQAPKLSDGLRALGATPVEVPVIEIRPPDSLGPLDAAIQSLGHYDWLILTSANAVRFLCERAGALGINIQDFQRLQVAVIGAATGEEAAAAGFNVTFVPESYVAESLVGALKSRIAYRNVLVARAMVARDVVPNALREAGATVQVVDAYQNVLPAVAAEQLGRALEQGIDAATFTSSSSATNLAEAARRAGIPFPLAGVLALSIGPITSQTLCQLGWPPAAEATPSDISGLLAAVATALR